MRPSGYSLAELLVTMSLALVLVALATPTLLGARDAVRVIGAADYVASLLHRARIEALKRNANVALRFEADAGGMGYTLYVDGNGDGVRTAQIASGVDRPLQRPERLEAQFPGVTFGLTDETLPIEGGGGFDDRDPIRVGRSRMVSFSPSGTCTSGTLYILGRGRRQLAVRILGATGRLRILEFNFHAAAWQPR